MPVTLGSLPQGNIVPGLLEAEGRGFQERVRDHLELPQVLLLVDRGLLFMCESKPLLAKLQLADHFLDCFTGPERHD